MKIKSSIAWIFFLSLCSVPALWGIFHSGFFVSDDGHWMVIRLSAFYEALSSGQFPVRFLPRLNQGFGYPVADFLYPLFLYVGSFLHVFKIPFLIDVKIILGVSIVLSGIGTYLFLRKHFSAVASFFGGLFFIYLPYHVYDVYVRGSVGEVVSLALVPFLFWAIERKSIVLSAIFVSLLILAHNTLALFFFPIAILYASIRKIGVRSISLFSIIGLSLSAFFWFPALFDKQFTIFDATAVSNPFAYFVNNTSYLLVGWVAVALFTGVFFVRFTLKERPFLFFLLLGLFSLLLSFSISSSLWHIQLLSRLVQFPYRFLSLTIFSEAFLTAYLIDKFKSKLLLTSFLVLLLFFSSLPYLFPTKFDYVSESFYDTNVATTTVQNEYMPRWVINVPTSYVFQRVVVNPLSGSLDKLYQKGSRITFVADMKKDATVTINFVYFPGWMASVDGVHISVASDKNGLLQLEIPKGNHNVIVWFGETPVRLIADIVSVLGLLAVIFLLVKRKV